MKPPPDSWLREHNTRVAEHIHRCNVERFLSNEFGGTDYALED
ncbi:MAG: hypothetical protein ACO3S3_12525 [Pseudohongiellaceae bacterium]